MELLALTPADIKNVPRFIPKPETGRVVSVYDGDTITIVSFLGKTLYKFSVRLSGIDTPEIRGSGAYEKKLAYSAKEFVEKMCLDKIVELRNHRSEKYGRVLAEVYVNNNSIGDALVAANLAHTYDGGKKQGWPDPNGSYTNS